MSEKFRAVSDEFRAVSDEFRAVSDGFRAGRAAFVRGGWLSCDANHFLCTLNGIELPVGYRHSPNESASKPWFSFSLISSSSIIETGVGKRL